jgi:formylglycine-generating enzyme required for sulfatase activity
MIAGGSETLIATIAPANATNQGVSWESDTPGVATVSGGVVNAISAGTAVITVTTADGGKTANCIITVVAPGQQVIHTLNGVSVPFRFVPAGSFQRDGTAANVSVITTGYWMGETEVTQELFQAVMGTNPSSGSSGAAGGETQNRRPVDYVNWYAAIAFCNKLSIANGKDPVYSVSGVSNWAGLAYSGIPTTSNTAWDAATMDTAKNGYRLPTEMEWMWAAMGADMENPGQRNTSGYSKAFAGSTGSNSLNDYVWHSINSGVQSHEVSKKAANELGLYDMSGNVMEWRWELGG